MPRVTKAELAAALEESQTLARNLQKENEDLKAQSAHRPRSRSPKRFPASSSQKQMDVSCKAFFQVKKWQRDQVIEEQNEKIAELTAENARNNEEIVRLRRGEGPVGEVMAHIDALENARFNFTRTPEQAEFVASELARQTQPVHEMFTRVKRLFAAGEETLKYGGPFFPLTIPARQRG